MLSNETQTQWPFLYLWFYMYISQKHNNSFIFECVKKIQQTYNIKIYNMNFLHLKLIFIMGKLWLWVVFAETDQITAESMNAWVDPYNLL